MMRRVVRWTIRIVLGIFLILIAAVAVLFVLKPEAALLLARWLFSNP